MRKTKKRRYRKSRKKAKRTSRKTGGSGGGAVCLWQGWLYIKRRGRVYDNWQGINLAVKIQGNDIFIYYYTDTGSRPNRTFKYDSHNYTQWGTLVIENREEPLKKYEFKSRTYNKGDDDRGQVCSSTLLWHADMRNLVRLLSVIDDFKRGLKEEEVGDRGGKFIPNGENGPNLDDMDKMISTLETDPRHISVDDKKLILSVLYNRNTQLQSDAEWGWFPGRGWTEKKQELFNIFKTNTDAYELIADIIKQYRHW